MSEQIRIWITVLTSWTTRGGATFNLVNKSTAPSKKSKPVRKTVLEHNDLSLILQGQAEKTRYNCVRDFQAVMESLIGEVHDILDGV